MYSHRHALSNVGAGERTGSIPQSHGIAIDRQNIWRDKYNALFTKDEGRTRHRRWWRGVTSRPRARTWSSRLRVHCAPRETTRTRHSRCAARISTCLYTIHRHINDNLNEMKCICWSIPSSPTVTNNRLAAGVVRASPDSAVNPPHAIARTAPACH